MDLFTRLLIQMSQWSRRAPNRIQVFAVLAVLGIVMLAVAIEAAGWWPETWRAERLPQIIVP